MLQIKITGIKDLIRSSFKKEPAQICKNSKDAHMNTIGEEFILVSVHKNAQVVSR